MHQREDSENIFSYYMTFYFEQVTYAYSLIGEGKALGRPVPER